MREKRERMLHEEAVMTSAQLYTTVRSTVGVSASSRYNAPLWYNFFGIMA